MSWLIDLILSAPLMSAADEPVRSGTAGTLRRALKEGNARQADAALRNLGGLFPPQSAEEIEGTYRAVTGRAVTLVPAPLTRRVPRRASLSAQLAEIGL